MGRAPTAAKVIRKKNDREIPQKKRPPPAGYLGWWSVNLKAGRGISPLQGLVIILRNIPRAMPWAFTWRPVGAWVIALRVNLENVPSVWRTSRPKGRGRATNHAFPAPREEAARRTALRQPQRGRRRERTLPSQPQRADAVRPNCRHPLICSPGWQQKWVSRFFNRAAGNKSGCPVFLIAAGNESVGARTRPRNALVPCALVGK